MAAPGTGERSSDHRGATAARAAKGLGHKYEQGEAGLEGAAPGRGLRARSKVCSANAPKGWAVALVGCVCLCLLISLSSCDTY